MEWMLFGSNTQDKLYRRQRFAERYNLAEHLDMETGRCHRYVRIQP
jgi:hypothetical protein